LIPISARLIPGGSFDVKGNPSEYPYIQRTRLNGNVLNSFKIPWKSFTGGGNLLIEVGTTSSKGWGKD
jgi:hypothetical protein